MTDIEDMIVDAMSHIENERPYRAYAVLASLLEEVNGADFNSIVEYKEEKEG